MPNFGLGFPGFDAGVNQLAQPSHVFSQLVRVMHFVSLSGVQNETGKTDFRYCVDSGCDRHDPGTGHAAGPPYDITQRVIERSTTTFNFHCRPGTTKIELQGTALLPEAHGKFEVDWKKGFTRIHTELKELTPPAVFGAEYLTYVLWAITPDGQPVNLSEIVPGNDTHAELDIGTELQAFGLVLTAEPYFAVTQPATGRPRKRPAGRRNSRAC